MRLLLKIKPLITAWARHPAAKAFCFSGINKRPKGFTLVEVIVTIIAISILGAIFLNYMGTAMSQSTRAIEYVSGEASAEGLLERIIAEFVYEMNRNPATALGTIAGRDYGSRVTKQFLNFVVSGTEGNQVVLSSGTSNTLKVTVSSTGSNLSTLLTNSRLSGSPKVAF
jgi:prepilin-type N-terminal cleavage/methylation domain-containing protein